MERHYILLFVSFGSCLGDWVLLPSIFPKENKIKHRVLDKLTFDLPTQNSTDRIFFNENPEFCPDFHNLTAMTFGSGFKKEFRSQSGWEISLDDVEELLKENEKLPKKVGEKANFVQQMGETLMAEAEKRIKSLFLPSREARTKPFHFISMESALMTISMLLFGVYLSKLILKLLLSHYNRYNGGITMMTGIRTPIAFSTGRKKRSMQLQEMHLMYLINNYESQFV